MLLFIGSLSSSLSNYSRHWQNSFFLIDTKHTIIVVALMVGDIKVLSLRTNHKHVRLSFSMCFGIHIIQARQQMFFDNFYDSD